MRRLLGLVLLLMLTRSDGHAQAVEVRLHADSSGSPIVGAIVRLLRNDSAVAQALSDEFGLARLQAPAAGSYRFRIDRIGFVTFISDPMTVERDRPFRAEIAVLSRALTLPEITVSTKSACKEDRGDLAGALWDEVRKALTANLLTEMLHSVPLLVREFHRDVSLSGRRLREWVFRSTLTRGPPFATVPARELLQRGFVFQDGDSTVFAAPDARLLLSDAFISTHCFSAIPGGIARSGLRFRPAPDRKYPDVAGTLWIDRASHELRELEYQYTGLDPSLLRERPGGHVVFERLPNGSWIVSEWVVRMPIVEESSDRTRSRWVLQFVERGGRSAIARDTIDRRDRAILRGRVRDSASGEGVAGALLSLAGSGDSARTGPTGEYALSSTRSGPQTVFASHPRLPRARAAPSRDVVLSLGDTAYADFAAPSLRTLVRAACGNPGRRSGLIGVIWTRGQPEQDVEIIASWQPPGETVRRATARSSDQGTFAFCELPADQPVSLQLRRNAALLRTITLRAVEYLWLDLGR